MTAPLISDATLAKIVRLAYAAGLQPSDRDRLVFSVVRDHHSEALDDLRRWFDWGSTHDAALLVALEEANEEAARTHDERKADQLLDPNLPEAEVDAMLRAEGIDPDAIAARGLAFVKRIQDVAAMSTDQVDAEIAKAGIWPNVARGMAEALGKVTLTAKHPIPYVNDAPEPPKRQEHDPERTWVCPKCSTTYQVERIAGILAARGERYAHVVRCLCGEVRP